jgi:hypothetical protein
MSITIVTEDPAGSPIVEVEGTVTPVQGVTAATQVIDRVPILVSDAGTSEATVVQSGVVFQDSRDYISRGYRDTVLVHGVEVTISPARTSHHDMLRAWPSMVDPLTASANFAVLNVAQPLVAIPGASAAPYWTDPGPLVYNTAGTGAGFIPASIPGQIDFVTHVDGDKCIRFTAPAGYGNGEAGKRRIQLNSYQITTRIPVAWDLSFLIPDEDDAPYDVATGYDYPVLIWQLKDATSQPVWSVGYETTADPNVFDLYVNFLYSDYDLDPSTYRRQYNAVAGTVGDSASALRVALTQINRNEWQDLRIEMFLDERDHTDAAGGQGYASMSLNGRNILEWSGPTYTKLNISGATPVAHRWSMGLYRFEYSVGTSPQGVPTPLKELDLNRAVSPAPYTRQMYCRRARLLKL